MWLFAQAGVSAFHMKPFERRASWHLNRLARACPGRCRMLSRDEALMGKGAPTHHKSPAIAGDRFPSCRILLI